MNISGGLKIAGIIMVITLGLSTLTVGIQLSSAGTAANTQNKVSNTPAVSSYNSVISHSESPPSSGGYCDLTCRNADYMDGTSPQRFMSGNYQARGA